MKSVLRAFSDNRPNAFQSICVTRHGRGNELWDTGMRNVWTKPTEEGSPRCFPENQKNVYNWIRVLQNLRHTVWARERSVGAWLRKPLNRTIWRMPSSCFGENWHLCLIHHRLPTLSFKQQQFQSFLFFFFALWLPAWMWENNKKCRSVNLPINLDGWWSKFQGITSTEKCPETHLNLHYCFHITGK